jgi:NAD(P)H-dependent FMN reductase
MILLISGSLRAGSTNTALLRTAAATHGDTHLYDRMRTLPHFDPDDDVDPLPDEVTHLRTMAERADAVLMCTPEYAGALPGSFKNALDWLVGCTALEAKPTTIVNVSAVGASEAQRSLVTVLTYLMADLGAQPVIELPVERRHVRTDGTIDDPDIRARLDHVLGELRDRRSPTA